MFGKIYLAILSLWLFCGLLTYVITRLDVFRRGGKWTIGCFLGVSLLSIIGGPFCLLFCVAGNKETIELYLIKPVSNFITKILDTRSWI